MNSPVLDKKSFWILALGILVTALFIYFPNPKMGYVLDDHYVIDRNPVVKQPTLARVFGAGLFDAAQRKTDSQLNYYRPLLTASFALEHSLWGSNPFAQRMVNLSIHVLNCVLVFYLFYLLFGNLNRAGLAAILFCILPVHEWSVRYIVGRGDLLSTFFGLASLIAVVLFIQKNVKIWLWAGVGSFVCALLCKESALVNLVYVLVMTLFAARELRRAVWITAFFAVVAAAYYFLRLQFLPISTAEVIAPGGMVRGFALGVDYLFRLWMPALGKAVIPFTPYVSLAWIIGCFGLLFFGLKRPVQLSDRKRACLLGALWLAFGLIQFLIVERFMGRLGPVLSEHFLYFLSIGFTLVIAVMIESIEKRFLRKAVFTGFVFFYVGVSIVSGRYWVSEEALLRHVQTLEGRAYTVAYEQLAMRFDDDERVVLDLIARAPSESTKSVWYRRLGDIYHKRRDYPRAKDALSQAVDLNPKNTEALNQLAVCFLETGAPREGLELLNQSITVDPYQSDAFRLSGIFYYRAGQFKDAIIYLNKALASNPDDSESALHVMMAYYFVNDQKSYLEMIDRLFSIDQGMMLRFAAQEFFSHGYFNETIKVIEQSQRLFQNDPAMMTLFQAARQKLQGLPK